MFAALILYKQTWAVDSTHTTPDTLAFSESSQGCDGGYFLYLTAEKTEDQNG